MTLVATAIFKEGTLVLSDSRASSENGIINADVLQKIVGINKDVIVGYAGSVAAVNRVMARFQSTIKNKNLKQETILKKLQSMCQEDIAANNQSFSLFVFTRRNNEWATHLLAGPKFKPVLVSSIELIGSGSTIRSQIVPLYEEIVNSKEELKSKSDRIIWNVSSLLASTSAKGVGGLIQALLLTPQGVRTIHTGFIDMNPEGKPESKQIVFENGEWVQHNRATGDKAVIMPPSHLLQKPAHNNVFHQYEKATGDKLGKWYLNCFIASVGIATNHFETSFIGPYTGVGVAKFPANIDLMTYISLWGPSTEHNMEIILVEPTTKETVLYKNSFDNTNFPEEFELIEQLKIVIRNPGNHYLQCKIDGQLAGTKLIYIHKVDDSLSSEENGKNLEESHRATADTKLKTTELAWFFAGTERIELKPGSHIVKGQFKVAYYSKFPFNVTGYVNFGIRDKPGKHEFNIEMTDAASHKIVSSAVSVLECSSTSIVQPCEVKFDFVFPMPGFYFIALKIDGVMKGCIVLMADGSPPTLTYTLPEEQTKKLENGELYLLAKRSVQSDEAN